MRADSEPNAAVIEPEEDAVDQNGAALAPQAEDTAKPHWQRGKKRGRYRPRPEPERMSLDDEYVRHPDRIVHALLLALLLRNKGHVAFAQKELDEADTDLAILYRISRDKTRLEVSVVSAESGIIRSPEAVQSWNDPQAPSAPPPPPAIDDLLAKMQQLNATQMQPDPEASLRQPQPSRAQMAAHASPGAAAEAELPSYGFPFEMGPDPSHAQPTTLDALSARLLRKDRQTALDEQRAAERLEAAG